MTKNVPRTSSKIPRHGSEMPWEVQKNALYLSVVNWRMNAWYVSNVALQALNLSKRIHISDY